MTTQVEIETMVNAAVDRLPAGSAVHVEFRHPERYLKPWFAVAMGPRPANSNGERKSKGVSADTPSDAVERAVTNLLAEVTFADAAYAAIVGGAA